MEDYIGGIIKYESGIYWSLFENPLRLPLSRGKENVQDLVFKVNSCRGLFGLDGINFDGNMRIKKDSISENLNLLIERGYSRTNLAEVITALRDEKIRGRRNFNPANLLDRYFVEVYDCVNLGLKDLIGES